MKEVKIDCSKCPEKGSCCGVFRMERAWVEKHRDKIKGKVTKTFDFDLNHVALLTEDCLCVFFDRDKRTCAVYDDRPYVCRIYGSDTHPDLRCPHFKPNGSPRSEASKKQVQRHFERLLKRIDHTKEIFIKD